jgi:hypothetical protein
VHGARRDGQSCRGGLGVLERLRGSRRDCRHSRRDSGLCRGLRLGRRRHDRARRQEQKRVDVALVLLRHAQPEVHERRGEVDGAARPDGSDDRTFADARSTLHLDRAQVHERRGVAGRRLDRHRLAPGRHGPSEAHEPLGGSPHVRTGGGAEVEATVLPGCVRMRAVERERAQHRAVDRPAPRLRRRHRQYEPAKDQKSESPQHEEPPCCQI